jgi:threonine aldolase
MSRSQPLAARTINSAYTPLRNLKPRKTRPMTNPASNPTAIVFSGDGEPHTPESTIERLNQLLAEGKLTPDKYSLGGNVEQLETRMAEELGKEAAIWMPTGTMANILGLRKHCGMNARVALQEQSHIYQDEGDALARLCGINATPLAPNRPYFTTDELKDLLHLSATGRVLNPVGAVSIETPVRRQAGQIMPWDEMKAVTDLCKTEGIPSHLDGARLYMMSAATGISIQQYTELFDSVYVSSYKYFGAPFGGILAGTTEFIEGMFNDRRMFGGGIPFGYLAAALSLDGLDGFEAKFAESMSKAKSLFTELNKLPNVSIQTFENGSNIFELILDDAVDADKFTNNLRENKIDITWPNSEWHVPLLHVNPSILRRPNNEIVETFANA